MNWAVTAARELNDLVIPHSHFNDALSTLLTALTMAGGGDVVQLSGPTRIGKSELVQAVKRVLVAGSLDAEIKPIVVTTATNSSTSGTFSTKAFTLNALSDAGHPIYGHPAQLDLEGTQALRLVDRTPEGVLRSALQQTLKHRRTMYFVVDEAHHVKYARGGARAAAAILDSWKCLAADANLVLVLVGAYPLVDVLRLSPHLVGRRHQVILREYRQEFEPDVASFNQILDTYSAHLQLPDKVKSLRKWSAFLMHNSLGCIGLLRAHLRQALTLAAIESAECITYEQLCRSRPAKADLECIRAELEAGRMALRRESVKRFRPKSAEIYAEHARSKAFQTKPRRYKLNNRIGATAS